MSATARARFRPGITDLVRREWYLTQLDWGLRNIPAGDSRQIRRDLRRDVTATAADIGMRAALADLGAPGVLAEQYTVGVNPEGPRYGSGAVAAGVTICTVAFLLLAYAIGTLDTLVSMGGGTRTASLWGSETLFIGNANEISFEVSNVLPMLLVILAMSVVAFLIFSRVWRLRRG